ncbi:MAG: hypothetical protein QMD85_00120 [Candidatus Aenigmarchaeota archaeon]|nr:hypothetical protein [Candidatus Aenigmarchaeota archaeon]MDI6721934.1 hypothetical protein [Candidatus Aenigmarchaeota archaeon]
MQKFSRIISNGLAGLAVYGLMACSNPLHPFNDKQRTADTFYLRSDEKHDFQLAGYNYTAQLDKVYQSPKGRPAADIAINGRKFSFESDAVDIVRLSNGEAIETGDFDLFHVGSIHGSETETASDDSAKVVIIDVYR